VLLVEDAADIRELIAESLERWGYQVLVASGAQAALEFARPHPGPIELLLTDIVMPEMNGLMLAQQLTAIRPEARVLYMTGHALDALGRWRAGS
jgi:CheY-like chemotaxis protein